MRVAGPEGVHEIPADRHIRVVGQLHRCHRILRAAEVVVGLEADIHLARLRVLAASAQAFGDVLVGIRALDALGNRPPEDADVRAAHRRGKVDVLEGQLDALLALGGVCRGVGPRGGDTANVQRAVRELPPDFLQVLLPHVQVDAVALLALNPRLDAVVAVPNRPGDDLGDIPVRARPRHETQLHPLPTFLPLTSCRRDFSPDDVRPYSSLGRSDSTRSLVLPPGVSISASSPSRLSIRPSPKGVSAEISPLR